MPIDERDTDDTALTFAEMAKQLREHAKRLDRIEGELGITGVDPAGIPNSGEYKGGGTSRTSRIGN